MSGMLSTVSGTHSTCQNVMLAKSFKVGKNFCELLLSLFNGRNSLSWDSNKPFYCIWNFELFKTIMLTLFHVVSVEFLHTVLHCALPIKPPTSVGLPWVLGLCVYMLWLYCSFHALLWRYFLPSFFYLPLISTFALVRFPLAVQLQHRRNLSTLNPTDIKPIQSELFWSVWIRMRCSACNAGITRQWLNHIHELQLRSCTANSVYVVGNLIPCCQEGLYLGCNNYVVW